MDHPAAGKPAPHAGHRAELFNPDGSPRYTNALARQSSPYLLQHAHNPVDWHPWGAEAFDLARAADKPIFVSIGYATCYWCHVMERQSFEDPGIAGKMNEGFICIKVDREERPDVDEIYMAAVQILTGAGGWPLNAFLTPPGASGDGDMGLKPFYAGTYFPPEPAYGRASFPQLLDAISDAWKNRRAEVLAQADQVADGVRQHLARGQATTPDQISAPVELIQAAANQLVHQYDPENGGFGSAPKFPTPNHLLFLLKVHENNPNAGLRVALDHTLDRMARGGIFDQIAGGFHRYSTDEKWLVPHFEKMLYDNAQLVEAYLAAAVPADDAPNRGDRGLYHRVVRRTCDYVLREMTDPTGAFWSAQDAEVDAREGGNYVWSEKEVRAAVGDARLAGLAVKLYGLDLGTNFRDPHDPAAPPANVLYQPVGLDELAGAEGIKLEEIIRDKESIDRRLLDAREQRRQPDTDDKILMAWNGMMIAALARAARDLDEPRYAEAAEKAARCVLDRMRTADGGLYRSMRAGSAQVPAFLEDYAFLVHGLVELHRTAGDRRWLDAAEALAGLAREKFADAGGGYYDTLAGQSDLLVRTRSTYDGALPSGNSQMVHNLLDLHQITGREEYMARAAADLAAFAPGMSRHGGGMAHMHHALLRALEISPGMAQPTEALPENSIGTPASEVGGFQPVDVEVEPKIVDLRSAAGKVHVTLQIAPGHHVNAHEPSDESLIPTTLDLVDAQGLELKVKYPPSTMRRFPLADAPLAVYEGRVKLEATLRSVAPGKSGQRPRLVLSYQACTEQSCLEPRSVELPVEFAEAE